LVLVSDEDHVDIALEQLRDMGFPSGGWMDGWHIHILHLLGAIAFVAVWVLWCVDLAPLLDLYSGYSRLLLVHVGDETTWAFGVVVLSPMAFELGRWCVFTVLSGFRGVKSRDLGS